MVSVIDGKLISLIVAPPKGDELLCSSSQKALKKINLFTFVVLGEYHRI